MTPKAGIVRAFLIAGIAVGLVLALMWVADSMVERIETASVKTADRFTLELGRRARQLREAYAKIEAVGRQLGKIR